MAVPQESQELYLTQEYLREHGWSPETSAETEAFFDEVLAEAMRLLGPEGRARSLRLSLEITPVEVSPEAPSDQDGDYVAAMAGPCRLGELHLPGVKVNCICVRIEKGFTPPQER